MVDGLRVRRVLLLPRHRFVQPAHVCAPTALGLRPTARRPAPARRRPGRRRPQLELPERPGYDRLPDFASRAALAAAAAGWPLNGGRAGPLNPDLPPPPAV